MKYWRKDDYSSSKDDHWFNLLAQHTGCAGEDSRVLCAGIRGSGEVVLGESCDHCFTESYTPKTAIEMLQEMIDKIKELT